MKIMGNVVGLPTPQPDWAQTDPQRADYIRNKPDLDGISRQIQAADQTAQEALPRSGGSMEGDLSMGGFRVTGLGTPRQDDDGATKAYVDSRCRRFTAVLPASGWTGDAAPYTQQVAVAGILETDSAHYGVVYAGDLEERLAQKAAFALVDDLDSREGFVICTCFEEKPETDLTLQLEVNR